MDPDGYSVIVAGFGPIAIPTNGTADLYNIPAGDIAVVLGGLAGNCNVDGTNPQDVTIPFAKTVDVAFTVSCTPAGSLLVTTTTAGAYPDPDGYTLEIHQGLASIPATSASLSVNGTVSVPGLLGTYSLALFDIMPNCDVTSNPGTVTVSAGVATPVGLALTCGPPKDLAFVRVDGANADVYLIASNGTGERRVSTSPVSDVDPAWSADGSKIAFTSERDGNREIYVMNADGSNLVRLTNSPSSDDRPAWSPDGTKIVFVSARDGTADIYVMNADGTNPVRLTNSAAYDAEPAWSPDGSRIAFSSDRDGTTAIWVMNADGSAPTRLTTIASPRGDRQPAWSPDGTKIAFSRKSATNTNSDIFVVNADGTGVKQLTRFIDNAADPAWSPDGSKIALGSQKVLCGFYDYDCGPLIFIVGADGGQYYSLQIDGANPAWRP
jgi:tricorn protease-like protein